MENKKLAKASGHLTYGNNEGKPYILGYYNPDTNKDPKYHDVIKRCRHFYKFDPIASTVINRMADMSVTKIRHKRRGWRNSENINDVDMAFFNAMADRIRPFLKLVAIEYFVHGLAVPEYIMGRIRGNLMAEQLGRKRYWIPENLWVRNPEHLELKRRPYGMDRQVFLKIPDEDIQFIQNKGKRSDGNDDIEGYLELVSLFPDYVKAVQKGQRKFLLPDVRPIYRKLTSYDDYPQPFLQAAVDALQHKAFLKKMDQSIASRAIEAIRHIKVGSDEFPADDDDITFAMNSLQNSSGERIFNWFTNHVTDMAWVFPPLDVLINEAKYVEPNADIFLAMGFPRVLTVGETQRSNSSDASIASLGPKSTLEDMREAIIAWVYKLYVELAERNEITRIPEPYFAPIAVTDMTTLVQFAGQVMKDGAISKDTVAQLYGTTWEDESAQIIAEQESGVLSPTELASQRLFEQQQVLGGQSTEEEDNSRSNNDEE